jgi:type IV secretory pathway TraG/TraD family ATPase VirD4
MCWLVVQELEILPGQGGKLALETYCRKRKSKQIFGASGAKTCELISRMLGEQTVKSVNYNLGRSRLRSGHNP